jgi:hypothetical protein
MDVRVYQELLKFFRAFVVLSIYLAIYIAVVHFQPLFNVTH